MRSLQLRIVAAIVLVCAAAIAAVALYVGRTTLLLRIEAPPDSAVAAIGAALAPALRAGDSAAGIGAELTRLAASYDVRIVIVNPATRFGVASWGPIAADAITTQPDGAAQVRLHVPQTPEAELVLLRGGAPIAGGRHGVLRLFILPKEPAMDALAPVRGSILGSLWKSAALGLTAALAVAVLLGSSIVKPIRELTAAAQAMSKGDSTRRVLVSSDDEIGRMGASFNAMADAIETTERLRRQMITDVAHELRSPLTRMIVQLEAANDGHISQVEALAGLGNEAERLARIVDDLRDLSLADAHELRVALHDVSLGAGIDAVIERMKPNAAKAQVALACAVPENLPMALGDELRIAQILDNLVTNALHYTSAGGCITVGARAIGEHMECFVEDNGAGIAPEHLPFIFERFYRADPSRSRSTGGSGLGLAIVKSLVEALGGSVAVESRLGSGSRFSWTLRRADAGSSRLG